MNKCFFFFINRFCNIKKKAHYWTILWSTFFHFFQRTQKKVTHGKFQYLHNVFLFHCLFQHTSINCNKFCHFCFPFYSTFMSSTPMKRICAAGDSCNQRAIAYCEGCEQRYCPRHFEEHRNLLQDNMTRLIQEHDDIKNSLEKQRNTGEIYQPLKRICDWEQKSIVKIKERANELRIELGKYAETHNEEFKQKFEILSKQINEYRQNCDFIESDLYRLKQEINDLKLNFTSSIIVQIEQHDGVTLVENIKVTLVKQKTNELFEEIYDNRVAIEQNGQLIIHDKSNESTEIRGKNEYTTGCHNIRLHIEETQGSWMFIGINSKSIPLKNQSYSSESSYGWCSNNYIWTNGQHHQGPDDNPIEMKKNDVISLFFDCINCRIRMINERTRVQHELPIITDNCPFPWQLHLVLREPDSRVQILSD